jgi:hypothetical protein
MLSSFKYYFNLTLIYIYITTSLWINISLNVELLKNNKRTNMYGNPLK